MKSTAIITGASRGVGRATAAAIASTGKYDCLVLNSRRENGSLEALADELTDISPDTVLVITYGDVGNYYYVEKLRELLRDEKCHVELLINNAAVSYVGLLTDMTRDEWNETISTNLTSLYNTCHIFVPEMVSARRGTIINISSVWGIAGASCEVAYSATKGALNSFTRALAKELAPSGIRVNAVALGVVDTDMNKNLTEEDRNLLSEEIPVGRFAEPCEAAEAIVKLIEMPDYFTGEIVKLDGGWI